MQTDFFSDSIKTSLAKQLIGEIATTTSRNNNHFISIMHVSWHPYLKTGGLS